MKKLIVMLLVGATGLVGMASAAGALSSAETSIVGRGGSGGDRYWACAGDDTWREMVCVDPTPASTPIVQLGS